MDWGHMMDWWGIPLLGLWFIGIFIVIVLVVVYLIIHSEKTEEKEIMNDAQKILDERYAKGEMTRKEYIQAKEDLKNFKSE
jgi:putative membrane protein